jgi:hypothetical protein
VTSHDLVDVTNAFEPADRSHTLTLIRSHNITSKKTVIFILKIIWHILSLDVNTISKTQFILVSEFLIKPYKLSFILLIYCIHVFCLILAINSGYFPEEH